MDIVNRINYLMKLRGIDNVWQLSKVSGVLLTTLDGIIKKDTRRNGPRIDTLEKICNGLEVSLIDFFNDGVKIKEENIMTKYNINEAEFLEVLKIYQDKSFMKALNCFSKLDETTREILIKAIDLSIKKDT